MSYLNYEDFKAVYWNSLAWDLIRKYLIQKHGQCVRCGETNISNLIIHHLSYQNFPFDKEEDLLVLCKQCHMYVHGIDDKLIYNKFHPTDKNPEDDFNLIKLAKGIPEEYSKCCDLCSNNSPLGTPIPIRKITLWNNGNFQNAFVNNLRHLNRTEITICSACWDSLKINPYPFLVDITKNPQLAHALMRNPNPLNKPIKKDGKNKSNKTL